MADFDYINSLDRRGLIKVFNLPKCFFAPEDSEKRCICKKIYAELVIDFRPTRVYMCKDWFSSEIQSYIHSMYFNIKYIERHHIEYAREAIYKEIINNYFDTPILDFCRSKSGVKSKIMMHNYYCADPAAVWFPVELCKRPWIVEYISALKTIEYRRLHMEDCEYMPEFEKAYEKALLSIGSWLDNKKGYKKYAKYNVALKKLKETRGEKHLLALNEIALELLNIKTKNYETSKQ